MIEECRLGDEFGDCGGGVVWEALCNQVQFFLCDEAERNEDYYRDLFEKAMR